MQHQNIQIDPEFAEKARHFFRQSIRLESVGGEKTNQLDSSSS